MTKKIKRIWIKSFDDDKFYSFLEFLFDKYNLSSSDSSWSIVNTKKEIDLEDKIMKEALITINLYT